MDIIHTAKLFRANGLIKEALAGANRDPRAGFREIARSMMESQDGRPEWHKLATSANPTISKAATAPHLVSDASSWGTDASIAELARSYIASTAETSILDLIALHGLALPPQLRRPLVATGLVADAVGEDAPKPVRRLGLALDSDAAPSNAVAMIVASRELLQLGGDAAMQMFEAELASAVTRGVNANIVAQLIATAGTSAATWQAAIALAGPASMYVVALPAAEVAALAVSDPAAGLGIRGGMIVPGVTIVALDGLTAGTGVVIPADRMAIRDYGVQISGAGHATVELVDDPDDPATAATVMTSLWQADLVGLRGERSFILGGDRAGCVAIAA